MLQPLERAVGDLLSTAVGSGAKSALTQGAGILGVSTGAAFVPFGAVLAPWIAAADVVRRSGDMSELHDLKEHALSKKPTELQYYSKFEECYQNIKYVMDKKERTVGRITIGMRAETRR